MTIVPRITSQPPFFFFQAEDGIRDHCVTGVQTCALPIFFGEGLSFVFVALAMTLEAMAEDFVEEDSGGATAKQGGTVIRFGCGSFAEIFQVGGDRKSVV